LTPFCAFDRRADASTAAAVDTLPLMPVDVLLFARRCS